MSPIPSPKQSILIALGLSSIPSCQLFKSNSDTNGDTANSEEIVVGPCLSQEPYDSGEDTAIGPCLSQQPPDTGEDDSGFDTGGNSDENSTGSNSSKILEMRNEVIQNLIESGILPADFAKKKNE